MSDIAREDTLDSAMSGQSHTERLIDSVCAELNAMAVDLKICHTVNGEWPAGEKDTLYKYDHLRRMAVELRKLKSARTQAPASGEVETPCARCNGQGVDPDPEPVCCGRGTTHGCCGEPEPDFGPCRDCAGTGYYTHLPARQQGVPASRLKQIISKASFSTSADKSEALSIAAELSRSCAKMLNALKVAELALCRQEDELRQLGADDGRSEVAILTCRDALTTPTPEAKVPEKLTVEKLRCEEPFCSMGFLHEDHEGLYIDGWNDAVDAILTTPTTAATPAKVPEECRQALQDAFDIIQADANTEENYGSLCRIGHVLSQLTTPAPAATPEAEWVRCSERLPTEADADDEEAVWWWVEGPAGCRTCNQVEHASWDHVRDMCLYDETLKDGSHWKPTGLKRPTPPHHRSSEQ
ncbi:hypothetical protein [Marinobacter salarius]|uniref:hypothetical protein n=1 Tax=Marinobacter salarius TaxID=1420917 RepID=UPI003D11EE94